MDTKYLEIIKAPLVTEKSTTDKESGKYTFLVSEKATKTEIKEAIEKIFKVKVESISTLNIKVKKKRVLLLLIILNYQETKQKICLMY